MPRLYLRFSSDGIGNPLRDGTWRYSWEHGSQLASMFDGQNTAWHFTYNAGGMRTSRTAPP